MSSVNFMKCRGSTGEAAAMINHMTRHDDLDASHAGETGKRVQYRNKYINREHSNENYMLQTINGRSERVVEKPPQSREIYGALRDRLKEIDAVLPPKRKRKDRVTIISYTVAAPEGLTRKQEEAFFKLADEEINQFSGGAENCSPSFVHYDEIHDYVDTDGQTKTSRAHLHKAGLAYVEGVGVNGKQFETRTRMRQLNKSIDDRCRKDLGIRFMTGERGLSGRSVEDLQSASEKHVKKRARNRVNAQLQQKKEELAELEKQKEDAEEILDEAQRAADRVKAVRAEVGDLDRIRSSCISAVELLTEHYGHKDQTPIDHARRVVEDKRPEVVKPFEGLHEKTWTTKAGKVLAVPKVKDRYLTWSGYAPVYQKDALTGISYHPYGIWKPGQEHMHPAYGDQGAKMWAKVFSPEHRDLLEKDKEPEEKAVLSDEIQEQVDQLMKVVRSIDRYKSRGVSR